MRKLVLPLLIIFGLVSCSQKQWLLKDNSLIVYPTNIEENGAKAVKITAVNESIIEVISSASDQFSSAESLIVVPSDKTISFSIQEQEDTLIATTSKTMVKVSISTGKVHFFNANGEPVVKEKQVGGKLLESIEVEGTKGFSLRQVFETPDDEAIYGLGQHQADEMNYKGKNEELFQYNTKVSIPFIVSTKNYGILWDNYSLSRFGDKRPYSNIDQFTLYNKKGEKGGLTVTYIDDKDKGEVFLERVENIIDYENLETIKNFPEGFNFNNAKITWEGEIEANETGLFRFLCYYAGYTKLWVDGELQFYKWRTAWNPSVAKFNVDMKSGEKHKIKLEWLPDGGVSYIGLKALSPIPADEQKNVSFYSEMGDEIRYYYMNGESMDEVISHYRTLTGKAQIMPKWSMGFWQSRERYKTQDELLDVLAEFRKRQIPIDNIVLDWNYWPQDSWGSHDFDLSRFPDVKKMVDSIHAQNARVMISVWPKFYYTTDNYKAFDEKGWMYQRAVKDSVRDWIAQGYIGSFYDAYNSEARELFWQQLKEKIYPKGFDAWWLDATEPDIQSNASIEYRKQLMTPTALGPSTQYFNAYALMNAKGIYEGQRSLGKDERVFILTRSGFAGIQRYGAVTWSGDIGTRWEDMKAQISAGINFAMAGLPYWTMDIGGFCVEKRYETAEEGSEDLNEWRELNTRWYQFGAFAPLFRVHGQYPYREIFNIAPEGHPAYQSMLYYNKLRYRLMPYIYSLAGMTYLNDYTIMRGLAMDFTHDKNVYDIGDQFMFGPSLMVCPVYEYQARSKEIYLPESKGWYDIYSGSYFEGGKLMKADAPYERMPLFVKAGSILPIGPEIEYTTQKAADLITLYVYTGDDAEFTLYEDEGDNYNYEKGKYALIPIKWDESDQKLTIGNREGEFEGMLKERKFKVVFVSKDKKVSMLVGEGETINYSGKEIVHLFNK